MPTKSLNFFLHSRPNFLFTFVVPFLTCFSKFFFSGFYFTARKVPVGAIARRPWNTSMVSAWLIELLGHADALGEIQMIQELVAGITVPTPHCWCLQYVFKVSLAISWLVLSPWRIWRFAKTSWIEKQPPLKHGWGQVFYLPHGICWSNFFDGFSFGNVTVILDVFVDDGWVASQMGSGPEDLKPENVFLSATGYVKLVEFSLAKVVHGRTEGLKGWSQGGTDAVSWVGRLPSGKLSHNYGKSPFLMGKSAINHHFP